MENPGVLKDECLWPKTAALPAHFLSRMLDVVTDVVCVIDEVGYCRYINNACHNLWGYHPQELIDTCFMRLVVEEDVAKTTAFAKQVTTVFPHTNFTNHIFKKNGTVTAVQWSVKWVEEDRLYYCTITNGAALKSSEERLAKAQMLASVGSFEFDLINNVYTYTSDSLFAIFGIDRNKHPVFTTQLFWQAIHPDDLEFVKMNMLQPEHLYKAALEYRIVRPDGEVVYIKRMREVIKDETGQPIKTIGTLQDITNRKITELALIQSGKRLKALVENGSDLIAIIDSYGNYIYAADSVKQILGYDAEWLQGKNALQFIHPDDQQLAAQALSEIKSKKYVKLKPFRFKNRDGEWRWMESKVANFTDDAAINGLIVNSHDITEQKNRQDKIRELSLIATKTTHAIMLSDKEHRITWVNQAFTDLSEYTQEEVMGKNPQSFFTSAEANAEVHQQMQHELSNNHTIIKEILFYSKSGRQYWMELQVQPVFGDNGEFIQHLAIGKDITEKKKMNAQLALSEQRFKALVQNGSDLIVIMDEKGYFQYVSENVQELLNYEPESLIGKNAFDLIHEEERENVWAELQKVIGNNAESKGVQHRFLKADGSWIWLESKGTNHLNNRSVAGILINARDINERVELQKKLDNELRNRQKELTTAVINAQEQERSQLGLELHDNVNQILTTVKLYNEMFLSGYHQDKELIKKSTVYLQECINEIRSISKRLSAPTLGHISLHDSIQELIDSLIVTRQLEILFRPYQIEQLCIGQELHLTIYRIIQEGLNNIIKYAEATTAIISIRYWQNTLNVTIYDDGKGFDTKLKRSGIGLTNMRTRAENMNGSFELKSAPGNGCSIKMVFPLPKENGNG